ncbi:MAG: hypothetical protein MZV63_66425 [Marinilabiliales bacterium]|nr:hypothetical protein [Marinilabiliales bacterium]
MSKKGWLVTAAGLGLNLALGILYAWSMFSKQLTEPVASGGFGWTRTAATLPYTIAIACFALIMVPAGRLQDKLGPRVVATAGAVLCGLGLVVSSLGAADRSWPLDRRIRRPGRDGHRPGIRRRDAGGGQVVRAGEEGPHHRDRRGRIRPGPGLHRPAVQGASRLAWGSPGRSAPWASCSSSSPGISAQFLVNPKPGQVQISAAPKKTKKKNGPPLADATWREMIRTPRFWSLYVQFACGATAGLMVIGHIAKIVSSQSGGAIKAGFVFVALMAVFNAGGRVVAGFVSDIIGRVGGHDQRLPAPGHRSCSSSISSRPRRASSSAPRSWASTTVRACRCSRRRPPTTGGRRTSASITGSSSRPGASAASSGPTWPA